MEPKCDRSCIYRPEPFLVGHRFPRWPGSPVPYEHCLIKEFHCPAINQELVPAVLEEEGWPARIDDPLPWTFDINPKVCLHDTIKNLNRHRLHREISFQGNDSGRGICYGVEVRDLPQIFPRSPLDRPTPQADDEFDS